MKSYAEVSVPDRLELKQTASMGWSIFARGSIPPYTRFGPLVAPVMPEVDIADDCTMQTLLEIYVDGKSIFYSIDNNHESNWLKYLKPATSREGRNVALVSIDSRAYFVTCTEVEEGCELLYWSDDCNSAWARKKIEKMSMI